MSLVETIRHSGILDFCTFHMGLAAYDKQRYGESQLDTLLVPFSQLMPLNNVDSDCTIEQVHGIRHIR
jgi:hypothetical protein